MAEETGEHPQTPERQVDEEAEAADFSERLLAFTVDFLLIVVPVGALGSWLGDFGAGIAVFAAFIGYHALCISLKGQTPGKWLAGIRVVTMEGATPAPIRAFVRAGSSLLSFLPLGLGIAAVFVTSNRRALHDYLAGTCVVKARGKGRVEAWAVFLAGWLLPSLIAANALYRHAVPRALAEAESVDAARATLLVLGALEEKRKAATGRYCDDINELARGAQSPQELVDALPLVLAAGSLKIRLTQDGYILSARAKDPRGSPVEYVWPVPPKKGPKAK